MMPAAIKDLMRGFKKAHSKRALGAEMGHHLGFPSGAAIDSAVTVKAAQTQINALEHDA